MQRGSPRGWSDSLCLEGGIRRVVGPLQRRPRGSGAEPVGALDVDQVKRRVLALVATFNEAGSLAAVAEAVLASSLGMDLLVVDDNSPDGTGDIADALARQCPCAHVLHRERREGLAAALMAGLQWGWARGYEWVMNLDGDLSHDPGEMPALAAAMDRADLVIGSRYVGGIRVLNWPARRLFLSLAAARYARLVTGMPFSDPTSGFRCFGREALKVILQAAISSRGYGFHIECLHRVWRAGGRVVEVPIHYTERTTGVTKLTNGIIAEAAWVTWRLLWQSRGRRRPAPPSLPFQTAEGGGAASSANETLGRARATLPERGRG